MVNAEAVSTSFQQSFVKQGDGTFAQQTVSVANAAGTSGGQTAGPSGETGFGIGSATAPAIGATIATHQPPAGNAGKLHEIEVTAWYSAGTPADATETSNMAFKFGGTVISNLPVAAVLNSPTKTKFYFNAAAGTPFSVVAVAAGSAACKYNAFITATKVVS